MQFLYDSIMESRDFNSIICYSKVAKAVHTSSHEWIDEKNVIYIFIMYMICVYISHQIHQISFLCVSAFKKKILSYVTTYVPVTKRPILYKSNYMKYLKQPDS